MDTFIVALQDGGFPMYAILMLDLLLFPAVAVTWILGMIGRGRPRDDRARLTTVVLTAGVATLAFLPGLMGLWGGWIGRRNMEAAIAQADPSLEEALREVGQPIVDTLHTAGVGSTVALLLGVGVAALLLGRGRPPEAPV